MDNNNWTGLRYWPRSQEHNSDIIKLWRQDTIDDVKTMLWEEMKWTYGDRLPGLHLYTDRYEAEKSKNAIKEKLTNYSEKDVDYFVNDFGFRGNWTLDNRENVLATFGCSFTYGIGVAEKDQYGSLIADHLDCQLFNFGVPGGSFNKACRYYSIVSKYQQFKYVIFVIPHIGRFEIPKYKDKTLTTMNMIPNWESKDRIEEAFRQQFYKAFDDNYLKFDTLRNIDHVISIAKSNQTQIYFSSWDVPTYDLLYDYLGGDSNMILPWFEFNRNTNIELRGRDGDHPGPTSHSKFYKRLIEYIERNNK